MYIHVGSDRDIMTLLYYYRQAESEIYADNFFAIRFNISRGAYKVFIIQKRNGRRRRKKNKISFI